MAKNVKQEIPAKGVNWDLSDLYSGINDPKIERDKKETLALTQKFIQQYKGKINSKDLTTDSMLQALKDYEKIFEKLFIYTSYASYLYSKNTQSQDIARFYQQSEEFFNMMQSQLLWFELEWTNLDDLKAKELINNAKLKDYEHYLVHLREYKPYRLNEEAETILSKKAQTSNFAFVRLYDENDSAMKYEIKVDGEIKALSYSELAPFLTAYPDRKVREQASNALTKGLKNNSKLYTFILNTLLLDKKVTDEIRNYKYPQQETFINYEVTPEIVNSMVSSIEKGYRISEKFYLAKKKLLGLESLYEWDRYSPIYPEEDKEYSWEESKIIVLDSFEQFSVKFSEIAKLFYNSNWIDAEITPGKRGGAYCSYNVPSLHPYVIVNFSGKIRDVTTVAHELGHAVHAYLCRDHPLLEAWPSTAVAEIASVFGEMLVFDKIYHEEKDKKIKINLLTEKIQSSFATIFRQNAFYLFECDIHNIRREKGELSTDDFNNLFQGRLQKMFGKGLTLTDGHKYWWMPILHFYHYNFYVFSYSLGEMLTLALYARYKTQGKSFVDDYIKALSTGGTLTPYETIKLMGIDIAQKDFWEKGLNLLENYVDEFVALTS